MSDINNLAHTKWDCKYHMVFAPKYRRRLIYGRLKKEIRLLSKPVIVFSPAAPEKLSFSKKIH